MQSAAAPVCFRARRWFYAAQFSALGSIAIFALSMGPLYLSGRLKDANDEKRPDAGLALTIIGALLMLWTLPTVFQFLKRSQPIIWLLADGIHFRSLGDPLLSGLPPVAQHVVGPFVMLFSLLTLRAFRDRQYLIPWPVTLGLSMTGSTLEQTLELYDANAQRLLAIPQSEVAANLQTLAAAIGQYARSIGVHVDIV